MWIPNDKFYWLKDNSDILYLLTVEIFIGDFDIGFSPTFIAFVL